MSFGQPALFPPGRQGREASRPPMLSIGLSVRNVTVIFRSPGGSRRNWRWAREETAVSSHITRLAGQLVRIVRKAEDKNNGAATVTPIRFWDALSIRDQMRWGIRSRTQSRPADAWSVQREPAQGVEPVAPRRQRPSPRRISAVYPCRSRQFSGRTPTPMPIRHAMPPKSGHDAAFNAAPEAPNAQRRCRCGQCPGQYGVGSAGIVLTPPPQAPWIRISKCALQRPLQTIVEVRHWGKP